MAYWYHIMRYDRRPQRRISQQRDSIIKNTFLIRRDTPRA